MMETMVSFNIVDHLWESTFTGKPEDAGYPRMLTRHRRPYPTKAGYICLMAVTDDQWKRLFEALERHDLAQDPRFHDMAGRTLHIDELYGALGEEMKTRTADEWAARLDAMDVPNARMNMLSDLISDEYLWETGFLNWYDHPSGHRHMALGFPIDFSASPAGMTQPPPLLGQHNREILGEPFVAPMSSEGKARS